jgi:hypothetical protein
LQFGAGFTASPTSGDWTSYCGKATPYSFIFNDTDIYVNVDSVSGSDVYVNCPTTTTTSSTTTTTTEPPTTTTTTTTEPPTTTTTTTTEPPTTSTTTTTTTLGFEQWTISTENDVTPIQICTNPTQIVYSAAGTLFVTGTKLYTDSALTTSLQIVGANTSFVREVLSSPIYIYDNTNGEIGADSGQTC